MYNSSFSQIPRDVTGERTRQWQCQIGDELHHGGPRWQVVAANALAGPPGTPDDIEDELQAAGDADAAEYPLLHKRDAQEAAWYAQLNSISGAYGVTPSFGYPTDAFLWESIHFSRTQPHAPLASAATVSRIRDMITAGIATDAFLQAYTAYWDSMYPGYGTALAIQALTVKITADDARRFLQYGGFPKVAPTRGTPEFRVEVEAVKSRWASCDVTSPPDPYRVLTDVVTTARAEWEAEVGAQTSARNAIVASQIAAWEQMRAANEALIESMGQAWVAERALYYQKARGTQITPAEIAAINTILQDVQTRIGTQVGVANQKVTAAVAEGAKVDTAVAQAKTAAEAYGAPPGRALLYAHQSAQVVKSLIAATQAAAGAANTAWQASKTTGTDSEALWAQAQAQAYAVQAQARRYAAEYAAYEAHNAALWAANEAQKAADLANRAKDDRIKAEAAEATAKAAAADAHAKMLAAKAERDNAAAQRAKAEAERQKAADAEARAQQQNSNAQQARQTAQDQAAIAAEKRYEAEDSEREASNLRNVAINAELSAQAKEAQAAAAEAKASAMDAGEEADAARAAATAARAAANEAAQYAQSARAAAGDATAAASAARAAATEAQASADRAQANAKAAEADVAITQAQLAEAHAAAADATWASQEAAQAVEAAKQQADVAAQHAAQARAEAEATKAQAQLSNEAAAVAIGKAHAAADNAAATRDAALTAVAAADNAIVLGTKFAETDTSAGMAVLTGQQVKTLAEQQAAAAEAKSAEAARAAQAAAEAAAQADADSKLAAQAAASAAADAAAAQQSVAAAARSAAEAAQEAAAAAASEARTAQYNAQAQQDAALAAQYAAEAAAEAAAALDAAVEAERDAAAARQAANQAEAAADAARQAAEQAERDATAAEAAAQHALADAEQAQQYAALAEANADAQARAALGTNSPTGEAGVQALPHVTTKVVHQTPIVCPPESNSEFCETTVTYEITGTIDFVLVTCPDLADIFCPDEMTTDHLATVTLVPKTRDQLVQLNREDVFTLLKRLGEALISDYVNCAKGLGIVDGQEGTPDNWEASCGWVAADLALPLILGRVATAIRALRVAMRTGTGFVEAYTALRTAEIAAGTLAKIEREIYRALQDSCIVHSFAADTPVLLADGSTKPISQIAVGEHVLTTDPATGQNAVEDVTQTFKNRDLELSDLTVRNAAGHTSVVHTTPHHPFWVDGTLHRWVDAARLEPGDRLHALTGQGLTVESVRTFTSQRDMYDLTVDRVHTYYIVVNGVPALVHNFGARDCGLMVRYASEGLPKLAHEWRVASGNAYNYARNVAAAVVEVDGVETVVYGISQGDDLHSEIDIINKIKAMKDNGQTVGKITELYSDRQVCLRCNPALQPYIADNLEVKFAVYYDDPNPELAKLINQQSRDLLKGMIYAHL